MGDVPDTPAASVERRAERVVETLLLAALVAAPWAYGGAPEPARYALAAGLLASLTLWVATRARRGLAAPALAWRVAGLPLLALAQAVSGWSVAPWSSVDAALLLSAFLGVSVFWSERARESHAAARRLAGALLLAASAQAAFGAVQQAVAPGQIYGAGTTLMTMPYGSFVNHNHFAGFVGLATLVAVGLAWGHARRAGEITPTSIALGGLALGLAATLFASRSRGGVLALGAGLVALCALRALQIAWQGRPATPWRLALGAGALLVAGAGAACLLVPPETRAHLLGAFTGGGARDASGAYRLHMAGAALRLWASRPLAGAGYGAFADAVTLHKRAHGELRATHAENDVLEVLSEGGLVGAALLAWLAIVVARRLRERLQQGRDALHSGLVAGAAAALAGLGVHSCFDFNLRLPANALAAASLLGLVAAGHVSRARGAREAAGARPVASGARAWGAAAAVGLALLASAAGWRALGAWRLERALQTPAAARLGALDEVLAAHPWRAEAWRERGLAWRALARRPGGQPGVAFDARLSRAERDLSQALRLRPAWAEAWGDRGWLRLVRGDASGARADVDRAVALDPTHVGLGFTRAEILAHLGDVVGALRQLARTADVNPDWDGPAVEAGLRFTRAPALLRELTAANPRRAELVRVALARP